MSNDRSASEKEHASRVRKMFANISPRYDLLNHLLSFNTDKRWRKKVARMLQARLPEQSQVLDVACGTGDLAITLFESLNARVIGIDFCRPMLEMAARKESARAISFVEGDALQLPFPNGSFAGVTIAFGLRNLASTEAGLRELLRVLKAGGTAAVLEFSKPTTRGFSTVFDFYFSRLLPLVGGVVSGSRNAYQYLPDSVSRFPDQEELASLMKRVGFAEVKYLNLSRGIAALHLGTKAQTDF